MKFKVFSFETLDSTSNKATTLLNEGHKAPFLVTTKSQTNGRGSRGRDWVSTEGNIFLTLVVPPPKEKMKQMGLLPIKAAVVLAEWFYRELNFRPTLKWPNDILFAGHKLAGILCESSVQGKNWGQLSIGIGINVELTPAGDMDYPVTSLKQVLSESSNSNAMEYQKSLIEFWEKNWDSFDEARVVERFHFYEIGTRQPWWHKTQFNNLLYSHNLDSGGSLILQEPGSLKAKVSLASVSHEYGWVYQNTSLSKLPLVIADAGNTSLKLYLFKHYKNNEPDLSLSLNIEDSNYNEKYLEFIKALEGILPEGIDSWPVFSISVSDKNLEFLNQLCQSSFLVNSTLAKRPILYKEGGYKFTDLGIDRLALMEGWLIGRGKESINKVGVLISAGTATTIDLIKSDGEHLGGLILPGLQTGLNALNEVTTLLPKVNIDDETMDTQRCLSPSSGRQTRRDALGMTLGWDTKSSMSSAVVQMTLGAIDRMIKEVCDKQNLSSDNLDIYITGGFSDLLLKNSNFKKSPQLLELGIKSIALGGIL